MTHQQPCIADDMFGQNDDDWAIYRQVVCEHPFDHRVMTDHSSLLQNLDHASEDEEDDLTSLAFLESKLLQHDPTFTTADTYSALDVQRSALMSAFRPRYEEGDIQGAHRIHLNVERERVPEAWFGPGAAGVDSAGLSELVESVLKSFSHEEQARLVKVQHQVLPSP